MEIYKLYSIDIFFQGTFLLLCISLGVYIVFKDNLETFKSVNSLNKFSKALYLLFKKTLNILALKEDSSTSSFKHYGIIPVIIICSFIIGIIGNGIADNWIDSNSKNHLELKSLWRTKVLDKINSTDSYKKQIRIKAFDKVFYYKVLEYRYIDSINKNDNDSIKIIDKKLLDKYSEQLYYQSKHEILTNNHYYNYIRKSQILVEYNRTFALGFFFIIVCSLLNFLLMTVRIIFNDSKDNDKTWENNRSGFISLGVILLFSIFSFLAINYFANPNFDFFNSNLVSSFFTRIIIYFGCITFLLNIFERFRKLRFSFFLYSIIYVISIVGYLTSAKTWVESENKVAKKVYGLYKTNHLSSEIEEIDFAIKKLKLNINCVEKTTP